MRSQYLAVITAVLMLGCRDEPASVVTPDDPAKQVAEAQMLYDHGLASEAKQVLFTIYRNEDTAKEHRAEALYWLSNIAADEGRYGIAAQDLERLVKEFPDSPQGKTAAEMLGQIRQVVTDISRKEITSPVAQAYMRHADFWGSEARGFTIDSSWLPKEDMAVQWCDRIIREFPKSGAAEEAYAKKISYLLGWEDRGVYSTTRYGAQRDASKYMPAACNA